MRTDGSGKSMVWRGVPCDGECALPNHAPEGNVHGDYPLHQHAFGRQDAYEHDECTDHGEDEAHTAHQGSAGEMVDGGRRRDTDAPRSEGHGERYDKEPPADF